MTIRSLVSPRPNWFPTPLALQDTGTLHTVTFSGIILCYKLVISFNISS